MSDTTHDNHDGKVHAHISSWRFLVAIFFTLIFLTFVTVQVSYYDFGSFNTVVALVVATIKASLVSLFFMHLRYDKWFNGFIFVMAFVFLGIFLLLTSDDIFTRGQIDYVNGRTRLERSGAIAPGALEPDPETPHEQAGHGASSAGTHSQTSEHH